MTAFGFGAEDFEGPLEDKLSEAVDRARALLRDLQHLGGERMSQAADWPFPFGSAGAREHAEPHAGPHGPAGPHRHEGHAEGHEQSAPYGAHEHAEPRPDDEADDAETGGGGGPWGGNWATGFSGKDWAGFFGGPRGGWRPGPGPRRGGWGGPGGPGGRGPGGPGGPGGPRRPKASRGDVRGSVLALLTAGPRAGYPIMSERA